jgi:fatty-acyl-CoA synthase
MALPLFHVGGALTHALQQLSAGGTLLVLSAAGWRNKNAMPSVWKLIDRYKIEVLAAVPTVIGAVLNVSMEDADISSLRLVNGGGSAIPVPVADAYKHRFGLEILETYGMTEASSCHTISFPDRPVYLGAVGRPLPYSQVRVVDVDDHGKAIRDCPPGKIGVVTMQGPGVFAGYVTGAPDAPFVEPGWVNSGDLGRIDANGYLWITGRAKDLIIRGGHNIYPAHIEVLSLCYLAVERVACYPVEDERLGERVCIAVLGTVEPDDLLAHLAAVGLSKFDMPEYFVRVDAFPLTPSGKILKRALVEMTRNGALAPVPIRYRPQTGATA